jgi:hypothetical protein
MAANNANAAAGDRGARQVFDSGKNSPATNSQTRPVLQDRRLDAFALRCKDLRDRVANGSIGFIDAVDMAASAAEWSGLADDLGWDTCQHVMAFAFGCIPMEARR